LSENDAIVHMCAIIASHSVQLHHFTTQLAVAISLPPFPGWLPCIT